MRYDKSQPVAQHCSLQGLDQTRKLSLNKFVCVARQVEGFCISYFAALRIFYDLKEAWSLYFELYRIGAP